MRLISRTHWNNVKQFSNIWVWVIAFPPKHRWVTQVVISVHHTTPLQGIQLVVQTTCSLLFYCSTYTKARVMEVMSLRVSVRPVISVRGVPLCYMRVCRRWIVQIWASQLSDSAVMTWVVISRDSLVVTSASTVAVPLCVCSHLLVNNITQACVRPSTGGLMLRCIRPLDTQSALHCVWFTSHWTAHTSAVHSLPDLFLGFTGKYSAALQSLHYKEIVDAQFCAPWKMHQTHHGDGWAVRAWLEHVSSQYTYSPCTVSSNSTLVISLCAANPVKCDSELQDRPWCNHSSHSFTFVLTISASLHTRFIRWQYAVTVRCHSITCDTVRSHVTMPLSKTACIVLFKCHFLSSHRLSMFGASVVVSHTKGGCWTKYDGTK